MAAAAATEARRALAPHDTEVVSSLAAAVTAKSQASLVTQTVVVTPSLESLAVKTVDD